MMVTFPWTYFLVVFWSFGLTCSKVHNFLSTDALTDGEMERLIHYNGLTAKETSVVAKGDKEGDNQPLTAKGNPLDTEKKQSMSAVVVQKDFRLFRF
ncbi:hypothetical protein J6590_051370 [Homalodisca vitripennis]|nr:hypothetical protein J6590_051370 [Homalodisca vitripennis]